MVRIFGAVLLTAGCGAFGFSLAAAHRKEAAMLRNLIRVLQEMEWELKYRMTELPELCCIAAKTASGPLGELFQTLAEKLRQREVMDLSGCVNGLIGQQNFPRRVRRNLKQFGSSLGRYDLEGQLEGLETVRQQCRLDLKELEENSRERIHSYQTLALCAGAALVILFI